MYKSPDKIGTVNQEFFVQRFIELTVRKGSTLLSIVRGNPKDLTCLLHAFSSYLPDGPISAEQAMQSAQAFLGSVGSWLNESAATLLINALKSGVIEQTQTGYVKRVSLDYSRDDLERAYRQAQLERDAKRQAMRKSLQEKNRRVNSARIPADPRDEQFMQEALAFAKEAERLGEIPVGCVIVKDGQIVGAGFNQSITRHDPSAHAEVIAIREAARALENYRLKGCTLYVTLEPCAMCTALIVHARIDRVVFGANDFKTGALGGVIDLIEAAKMNHRPTVDKGILAQESTSLLKQFFGKMRHA